jgi:hypothetical protein
MVGFGAGGPAKSDSSAGNSEPGLNPESRVQDTEPANCEVRTGATPDSFAGSRGLLRRVKGLFKDFIRCYEECRPEQPFPDQGTSRDTAPSPISPGSETG